LRAAEAGVYDARSLHRLSRDVVKRYFVPVGGLGLQLIDAVRRSVSFTKVNASDTQVMGGYSGLDVIFDDRSRQQTVQSFYDSLRPGGFICLGHSESMSRISSLFAIRKFPQAIVYQKSGGPR
jgi:chemotaxis protein methyltransferase CheR